VLICLPKKILKNLKKNKKFQNIIYSESKILHLFIIYISYPSILFTFLRCGGQLVASGQISPGTVFGVFWSVMIGALRLGAALPNIGVILATKMAAGKLFRVIDAKPGLNSAATGGLRPASVSGRIELKNVHFAYPSRPEVPVLNGISFTVGFFYFVF
jgi:ABC-type multidrug transport system fused ATPase/permease subunit